MIRDVGCTLCPLHEQCKTVCVPTTQYPCLVGASPTPRSKAVLILGEAPGAQEDIQGQPFVGPTGKILKDCYIDYWKLTELADVYLGNAVRCRPPRNETPKKSHISSCRTYLEADLVDLCSRYKGVYVLACGAVAAQSCGWKSLKQGLSHQGHYSEAIEGHCVPVFNTFHPSYLMRNPSAALQIQAHLRSFIAHLTGTKAYVMDEERTEILQAPEPRNIL